MSQFLYNHATLVVIAFVSFVVVGAILGVLGFATFTEYVESAERRHLITECAAACLDDFDYEQDRRCSCK